MRVLFAILISLTLAACGDIEDTKEYKAGYDAGYYDGRDDGMAAGKTAGKEEICNEVESRLNYGAASAVGC